MSKRSQIFEPERRYFESNVQIRAAADENESRTIEGYAFKYGVWSRKIMWFYEQIERGFIDDLNFDEMDVLALFNHNDNKVLARTISKTLQLIKDDTGLKYVFEAPNTTAGNDLLESVRRGDIQHSSFSFVLQPDGDSWTINDDGDELRVLKKAARIIDVSPVTQPAYLDTTVAQRSLEEFRKQQGPPSYHRREMARRKLNLSMSNFKSSEK